jgi:hypothetical protein
MFGFGSSQAATTDTSNATSSDTAMANDENTNVQNLAASDANLTSSGESANLPPTSSTNTPETPLDLWYKAEQNSLKAAEEAGKPKEPVDVKALVQGDGLAKLAEQISFGQEIDWGEAAMDGEKLQAAMTVMAKAVYKKAMRDAVTLSAESTNSHLQYSNAQLQPQISAAMQQAALQQALPQGNPKLQQFVGRQAQQLMEADPKLTPSEAAEQATKLVNEIAGLLQPASSKEQSSQVIDWESIWNS